jgi:hypothetical protein
VDHYSKFHILWPTTSLRAEEVAVGFKWVKINIFHQLTMYYQRKGIFTLKKSKLILFQIYETIS